MAQRWIFPCGGLGMGLLLVNPVNGQIIPDSTTNTSITNDCQVACEIQGGIVAEQNLFHSFQEFNIAPEAQVYFADPGVANIFSRITGTNTSQIFGTLGVLDGEANLFLINPNGIVFGEGAALDINGSFLATTADNIQFGARGFLATSPDQENLPLLTVNPSALFFNPGLPDGSITLDGVNLTVPPRQDLTLLGQGKLAPGNNQPGILLKNSTINVIEGNIALGALQGNASGSIKLQDNLQLDFPKDVMRGDIFLTEASRITAGTVDNLADSKISLDVKNLEIIDNSSIITIARSLQEGDGADIEISAQETIKIIGKNSQNYQQFIADNLSPGGNAFLPSSKLQTATVGNGDAGNIVIGASNLAINNGAGIISSTGSQGKSGNIAIDVANTVALNGSGLLTASVTSSTGGVGTIDIDSSRLLVNSGGVISSSTLGDGNAGDLTINATESIQIKGTPVNSLVATGIFTSTIFGNGRGGDLTINTPKLTIADGGQLGASSGILTSGGSIPVGGEGGNIDIQAAESIQIDGNSADGIFISSILSDTRSNQPAGNLKISTNNLFLTDSGVISASSLGTGVGGDIKIITNDTLAIEGPGINNLAELVADGLQGQLNPSNVKGTVAAFSTGEGSAGNIVIDTSKLNLSNGAIITTATYGDDDAGNLDINAKSAIDVSSSAIISPTFGAGDGGTLRLETKDLNVIEGGAIASASLGEGDAGDLSISATSIAIFDTLPDILFSGSISTGSYGGSGFSGKLDINTQRLSIKDGATIQANNVNLFSRKLDRDNLPPTVRDNNPQDLTIVASESIEISGSAAGGNIFTDTDTINSNISSVTDTFNPASNVVITTKQLSIFDQAEISVSSRGDGAAGKLDITADSVTLKSQGSLNGTDSFGQGGDIILNVHNKLSLEDLSVINTSALNSGNGGNIKIAADFIIASGGSSISANAAAVGNGGTININTNGLFLTPDSKITANSQDGIDGTVEIDASINAERNSYTKLPQQVIAIEHSIVQSCGGDDSQGVFSNIGKGGLPLNPLTEFSTEDILIADFDLPQHAVDEHKFSSDNESLRVDLPPVVEADGWQINSQGKVELIAATDNNLFASKLTPSSCALSSYR